jgi:hypothetical protein
MSTTPVLDRARQAIAQAKADGAPAPGRAKLAKLLDISQYEARVALESLAAEQTPTGTSTPPVADTPASEPATPPEPAASEAASPPPPSPGDGVAAAPPATSAASETPGRRGWPVILLAAPAFVAIWSGWVGVGALTGFGPVHLLPGIADRFTINSAITLPIGLETYAAYALRVWLASVGGWRARRFAKRSAITSLVLGALGQVAYHLMTAARVTVAPWPITTVVACLPVVVLGFGAALHHLVAEDQRSRP